MNAGVERLRKSSGAIAGSAVVAGSRWLLMSPAVRGRRFPRWLLWSAASLGAAITANELAGKPVLPLRWSFLRMAVRTKHLLTEWQVGDGREAALADHVLSHARPGDVDDAIRVIDEFCRQRTWLINVGEEKGQILDRAIERVRPRRLLELGTYCGYSALRTARRMPPDARLVSVEFNPAKRGHRSGDPRPRQGRRSCQRRRGHLGRRREHPAHAARSARFEEGSLDLVFVDHDKNAYVPDLQRILDRGWLHPGSVVVADNIIAPGAPEYRRYMRQHEGTLWRTTEHRAHVEYQSLLPDMVLESDYLGG
ncbi:MAG: O-methyltransferase [Frankiales bacterium]|nr:O-methyltransferase [Frankiales bacterium]